MGFPAEEFRALRGEIEARWIGLVRPKLLLDPPEVTVIVTGEDVGEDCLFIILFLFFGVFVSGFARLE